MSDFVVSQNYFVVRKHMLKRIRLIVRRHILKIIRQPPRKRVNAEIIVKHNFGLGGSFPSERTLEFYLGIAIFANRRGYRFLADHFAWLAKRPIAAFSQENLDPGDHVHLTPDSDYGDEVDFTFDTLTPENRSHLLENAGATRQLRRRGTPFQQFTQLVDEMGTFINEFCETGDDFRKETISDIEALINVLENKVAHLKNMENRH